MKTHQSSLYKKLLKIWMIVLVSLHSSLVSAKSLEDYQKLYDVCVDEVIAENSLQSINNGVVEACSNHVSDVTKKDITRLYKLFYDKLNAESPADALKFETAQKSWLAYRNAHCELMGSYVGSPMYGYCPMNMNMARAVELQELLGE